MTIHTKVQKLLVSRRSLSLEQRSYAVAHLEACNECTQADALFQANAQALAHLTSPEPPITLADAVLGRVAESRETREILVSPTNWISGQLPLKVQRAVALTIVLMLALIGGFSIAAAASSSVRGALQHALPFPLPGKSGAASNAQGEPVAIYPKPPFAVVYPQTVPPDMVVHFILEFSNGDPVGLEGSANCGSDEHAAVCLRNTEDTPLLVHIFPGMYMGYVSNLAQPIWKRNVDNVWLGMRTVPPRSRYIELDEWSNQQLPLSRYLHARIKGNQITVRQRGSTTTVFLVRSGTAIALRSNIGRQATLNCVATLRPIAIAGRTGYQ